MQPAEITRAQVVAKARETLGTPFRHQGRVAGARMDCVGMALFVAIELGQIDRGFDVRDYGRLPDPARMRRELADKLDPIAPANADAGDLVYMADRGWTIHLGILARDAGTGVLNLIHATSELGRVVEHRYDDEWRGRTRGAYRFRGLVG